LATYSLNSTSVTVDEALADVGARHVLGISGGKDSAALAIYLRNRVPDLEYFFTDNRCRAARTSEYLFSLEAVHGQCIVRLNVKRGFDHRLQVMAARSPARRYGGAPSS
jgi:3'-phosphoadenosine 5'-phosphosulfate sulfotransferase (PAPS reductase)/FAD synthetase